MSRHLAKAWVLLSAIGGARSSKTLQYPQLPAVPEYILTESGGTAKQKKTAAAIICPSRHHANHLFPDLKSKTFCCSLNLRIHDIGPKKLPI